MSPILPDDAARYPLFRLIGLFLCYLAGVAAFFLGVGLPSDTVDYSVVGVLIGPSFTRFVLLVLMAWQLVELIRPFHARPRAMVLYEDLTTFGELGAIGFGVFLSFALSYTGFGYGLPFVGWMVGLVPLLVVAWRRRTYIDGERRMIVRLGAIPHFHKFEDVLGLGTHEVRMMRYGAHVGSQHSVGLFLKNDQVIPILRVPHAGELPGRIAQIARLTGLPVAPPR